VIWILFFVVELVFMLDVELLSGVRLCVCVVVMMLC